MSKTLILLDTHIDVINHLKQDVRWQAKLITRLKEDGRWEIIKSRNPYPDNDIDFVDLFCMLANLLEIDLNAPETLAPRCVCPIECDCANPDQGLCSNSCPIHNENPDPDPDCPQHCL